MTEQRLFLFEVEMDYRPKNPKKPRYRIWAKSKQEALRYATSTFTWLNLYGCQVASRADLMRFTETPYDVKLYTYNYDAHWKELKEMGFV